MATPLEITFHGVEKSPAVEARIAEKVARLEKHFSRMTHCRVVIEAPHKHSKKGRIYQVRIEIGVPGHAPVVVNHEPGKDHAHEDLMVAVRDAFDAARRRIDDVAAKLSETSRTESARRKPSSNSKKEDG
jgi:ribosome-associated translation inhibitor RaiA